MKSPFLKPLPSSILALSFPLLAFGGSYSQDFTGSSVGATNLGDGSTISSNDGTASVQGSGNPYLRLTQNNTGGTSSSFKIADLDSGQKIDSWTFSFDLQIGGSGSFADGLSLTFGDIPGGDGGGEAGFAVADGLIIAWDTYNNGGDSPSIEVFSDGVSVENYPHNYGSTSGAWVPVTLHWDSSGLDLTYNGNVLATNLATPGFVPSPGNRFAFSGRTGGANQNTYLDNISVSTTTQSPILTGGPIISEFVANNTTLDDEDLDSSDWIEIYNGQNAAVNLSGYYLTNDSSNKTLWQFPSHSLAAYEYFTLFASGKDRALSGSQLHPNFTLPKTGGYLALIAPNGVTVISEFTFAAQAADVSYGELGQARTLGYLETSTPNARNTGLQAAGLPAESVQFDRSGGVFANATTLMILPTVSPSAIVRYTTNGTIPTESAAVYTSQFNITNTTTIRARVFETGRLPGDVKSRTLIELASDVQNFTSNLPIVIADSAGLNLDLASNPSAPRPFRNVYTVVIDRDLNDDLAHIDGIPDFTGRGGMHVRGQSSSGFPKKQYSWETWNNDDEDKDVPILGMPRESDWILHAPYSDKTLMRNVLVYDSARQLHRNGGGMRTRFVELFLNTGGGTVSMNDYRGVYVVMEKIKRGKDRADIEKLGETTTDPALITGGYIFKKDKPPYSQPWSTAVERVPLDMHDPGTINTAQANYLHGYVNAFERALHGSNFTDPVNGYNAYIDVPSFVDMHLFVETFKEIDGYRISTYFSKDRDRKIRALPVWDYNLALGNANYLEGQDPTGWYYTQLSGTNYFWYQRLFQDVEFDLAYWDRFWDLRRSLFSTPGMMALIDKHDRELDGSAGTPNAVTRNFDKWNVLGTYLWPNADGYQSRTTHQSEVAWMKNWLTQRLDWIETQSRGTSGLARPPGFNQYGGEVSGGFALTMSDPNSWLGANIYYTTDGTDPRVPGNAPGSSTLFVTENATCQVIVPSITNGGSTLTTVQWTNPANPPNTANWTTGPQGVGYEQSAANTYGPYIDTPINEMYEGNETCYIRLPFTINTQEEIDALSALTLKMRYDDGFVAYLNGVPIASANAPVSLPYNAAATATHADDQAIQFINYSVTSFINKLQVGNNILAIHGLNFGSNSSDALWEGILEGSSGNGGSPSLSAQVYQGQISLDSSADIKARVFDGSKWSPLTDSLFIVDTTPASASNLVVSELNYRPSLPTADEEAEGFLSRGDFEFIELLNIHPTQSISLEGVTFTAGVIFSGFDNTLPVDALILAPGERIVLVGNLEAFQFRHGIAPTVSGLYSGSLSNDGELTSILDATGLPIKEFTYNDVEPWPVDADGNGFSLVLKDPTSNPDHNDPTSWRSSVGTDGSPGSFDSFPFSGDPTEDDDLDGFSAFLEFATGTSDTDSTSFSTLGLTNNAIEVGGIVNDYLLINFRVNLAAEGINFTLKQSDDLNIWTPVNGDFILQSTTNMGNGTANVSYRASTIFSNAQPGRFYRLHISN